MKVVILCGGRGERMRPLTDDRPKPLVEVGGKPLLWHIIQIYAKHWLTRFVLACGHKRDMIQQWVLQNSFGDHAACVDTGEDTQTGGRLLRCKGCLGKDDTFLCTYGDGLSDVNLTELVAFHQSHGKAATVTVVQPQLPWGVLDVDADGIVTRFREKPASAEWASAGFFVFNRVVLDCIIGDGTRLEDSTLPLLADRGELVAFKHTGYFKGADTSADVAELCRLWEEGKPPWRTW